ncbi:MAG TPA: ABC transporter ATP-binding protein [Planctomycetes bacterium]|nr:ABC transporter ATP-binding protein [Planctomycetota bacterium]
MKADEPVVIANGLTKQYGEFTALDNLSLQVNRGQVLGFIGPNGAGKTTTISILVGLSRPTSGTATVAGADCVRDTQRIKQLVGFMPDTFGAYDNMRVREYLDFFGAAYGLRRKERRKRIAEVLEITNATWMQDRFVDALSHGMKQRVGIARILLHDPEVLILDEPANGLDPAARIEMRELLLRLADAGKTLIVTSHILPELARICNIVAIITNGKLRAFGTVDEIMATVNQERMVEVQLGKADQLQAACDIVANFIDNKDKVSGSETEKIVRFRTTRPEDELGDLVEQLVSARIRITQFREIPTDLEDAFLSVTAKDSESDAGKPIKSATKSIEQDDAVAAGETT